MHFDLVTFLGFGAVALAAFLLRRRARSNSVDPGDGRQERQQRDVARALKSMRKD